MGHSHARTHTHSHSSNCLKTCMYTNSAYLKLELIAMAVQLSNHTFGHHLSNGPERWCGAVEVSPHSLQQQ